LGAAKVTVTSAGRWEPGISDDDLAHKIVSRKAFENGLVGFLAGLPGFPAMPLTVPANLVASWKIQAGLIVAIAAVYGRATSAADLKTDIYLIMAGNSAKEVLKSIGIKASRRITRRLINRVVRRTVVRRLWRSVGRRIVSEAGERTLARFARVAPIVGGFVGYGCDWAATRWVGRRAIEYYAG
jgi:hypothetical protein